ncbi:hypothetical protein DPMN_172623 [Dreissena polymorpha]|uniref:Uncharacterized protein n=1 Tax=Dreissena polymorpha TaxID=45954 RepID=A0A9D4E058_DREPO|nr:hypothetical protein DPMN_172623 [Dreissena polymorpha]
MINNLRENTITELMETGIIYPKVFLVNNRNVHEYDFNDLITQLIKDTPVLKRKTLVRSMASLARTILDEKQKMLQKREIKSAILASTSSQDFMPGNSVSKSVLFCELKLYKQQFGTDDKFIADRMNTTFNDFVQKLDIRSTSIVRSVDVFNSFCDALKTEVGIYDRPVTGILLPKRPLHSQ